MKNSHITMFIKNRTIIIEKEDLIALKRELELYTINELENDINEIYINRR